MFSSLHIYKLNILIWKHILLYVISDFIERRLSRPEETNPTKPTETDELKEVVRFEKTTKSSEYSNEDNRYRRSVSGSQLRLRLV